MGNVLKKDKKDTRTSDRNSGERDPASPRTSRLMAVLTALLVLAFLAIVPAGPQVFGSRQAFAYSRLDVKRSGERMLFIAPHPDDEGLAAAGLIQRVLKMGIDVRVVVLTAGDASAGAARAFRRSSNPAPRDFRLMGEERVRETRSALKIIGLSPRDVIFLGYADGSLNSLWDTNWDYGNLHVGRNGTDRSPYPFAYEKGAPCCGANLEKNLTAIFKSFKPNFVVYPDEDDAHHDHWAANAFTQYVIVRSGYRGAEYTYLVHRHDFPVPRSYAPYDYLTAPYALRHLETNWKSVPLTRHEEDIKELAIRSYKVPQMTRNSSIRAFVRRNELFGTVESVRPEHIGRSRPDFTLPIMPYVVERDPVDDGLDAPAGGELRDISLCMGDTSTYVALQAQGNIMPDLRYAFRMRVFRGKHVDRYDIDVAGRHATCMRLAQNSVLLKRRIPLEIAGARMWISLPSSVLSGAGTCMLSVDAMNGPRRVDHSAWRRLSI